MLGTFHITIPISVFHGFRLSNHADFFGPYLRQMSFFKTAVAIWQNYASSLKPNHRNQVKPVHHIFETVCSREIRKGLFN